MENGKKWFHNDNQDLHLLFEPLSLNESTELAVAYTLIAIMCALERGVSYWLDNRFHKSSEKLINTSIGERIYYIVIRTVLYGIATTLRLLYMLAVMYFNTGLFITVVTSLTLSQLVVELIRSSDLNKTGPLKKLQNKGYSDLSIVAQNGNMDDDEEDEYDTEAQSKEYNIPKIVISGES
ncbi:hypothetical protein HPULCUR_004399 [Helicostylum pulchrum]|uniref:Copper transport protein n=1 Tax=Helicostylum pulchrum TaxID=562976 RepID=A0ABP9XW32_9FUNG